jgi:hypothetical protein
MLGALGIDEPDQVRHPDDSWNASNVELGGTPLIGKIDRSGNGDPPVLDIDAELVPRHPQVPIERIQDARPQVFALGMHFLPPPRTWLFLQFKREA